MKNKLMITLLLAVLVCIVCVPMALAGSSTDPDDASLVSMQYGDVNGYGGYANIPYTPAFDPLTLPYTATRASNTSRTEVRCEVANNNATVTMRNGATLWALPVDPATGLVSTIVIFPDGPNTIYLDVTSANGLVTQSYAMNIDINSATEAYLTQCGIGYYIEDTTYAINTVYPTVPVQNTIFEYKIFVPESATHFDLNDVWISAAANILAFTLNGQQASSLPYPFPLRSGSNVVYLQLQSEDGLTTNEYNIYIDRHRPANPKTGDSTPSYTWMIILGGALLMILSSVVYVRLTQEK